LRSDAAHARARRFQKAANLRLLRTADREDRSPRTKVFEELSGDDALGRRSIPRKDEQPIRFAFRCKHFVAIDRSENAYGIA
jgi:hypothetical protein